MLICKNCQSNNVEGSTSCSVCKMPGMLVRDNTLVLPDREPQVIQKLKCRNCGTENKEDHSHCTHCKFPLPFVSAGSFQSKTHRNS